MAPVRDRPPKLFSLLYRSLIICLGSIIIIIILGTVFWGISHDNPLNYGEKSVLPESVEGQTFTGIGRLRISTIDPMPGMVIIFVSFVYFPEDKVFAEELVLRIGDFRKIIETYIGSFAISDLRGLEEESIKYELLRRLNSILRLGQIKTLYFSDFLIVG